MLIKPKREDSPLFYVIFKVDNIVIDPTAVFDMLFVSKKGGFIIAMAGLNTPFWTNKSYHITLIKKKKKRKANQGCEVHLPMFGALKSPFFVTRWVRKCWPVWCDCFHPTRQALVNRPVKNKAVWTGYNWMFTCLLHFKVAFCQLFFRDKFNYIIIWFLDPPNIGRFFPCLRLREAPIGLQTRTCGRSWQISQPAVDCIDIRIEYHRFCS